MPITTYEVRLTLQAQRHLRDIAHYIHYVLMAPMAAEDTLNTLQKAMVSLELFPARYAFVKEEEWRNKGIRKLPVKNFLVYFWLNEADKYVQVIAIYYAKREQINSLKEIKL